MAASAPWVAARQPRSHQVAAPRRAVSVDSLDRIARARRLEPALVSQPGAEQESVTAQQQQQQAGDRPAHGETPVSRPNIVSSSARVAQPRADEAALAKLDLSNGDFIRTTHSPPWSRSLCVCTHARMCRLIRLRVTARRARRLGTTVPSQTGQAGPRPGKSSTPTGSLRCRAVDNVAKPAPSTACRGRVGEVDR